MLSKVCLRFHTLRCAAGGKQVSNVCYKSTSTQQKKRSPRSGSLIQRFRKSAHTNSVVVQNINWSISKQDLQDHFSQYASIDYINYPLANSGFHLGYAEVKFEDDTTFEEVLKRNSVTIDGYDVKISDSDSHFQNVQKMYAKKRKEAKQKEETSSPPATEGKVEESESEPLNTVGESEEQQEAPQKSKKRTRKRKKAMKDTNETEKEDTPLSSTTEAADVKQEKLSDSDSISTEAEVPKEEKLSDSDDVIVESVQVGAKL